MSLLSSDEHIRDRVRQGEFQVHRDVFRNPELFELEVRHIFAGTWMFLGMDKKTNPTPTFEVQETPGRRSSFESTVVR